MPHPLLLLLALAPPLVAAEPGRVAITVRETAGLRRFGYPVHASIALPRDIAGADRFRLLSGGKAIPAQIRKVGVREVAVGWTASPGPFDKATYTLEYGEKVVAGPEPRGGMTLERADGRVAIRSGGMLYAVKPNLAGLLDEVRDANKTFLPAGKSAGLTFRPRGKAAEPIRAGGMKVVREGPEACGLRWTHENGPVSGTVDLTFPRSKSWVEVVWTVSAGDVEEMRADLSLSLEGSPSLADFGAGSMVYTTLKKDEVAILRAGKTVRSGWEILTGKGAGIRPFALARPGKPNRPEGWAHLMDRRRCVALAVAGFASGVEDRIELNGAGRVTVVRRFGPDAKGSKVLRFWLHFVDTPVQIGALTSPQSMADPLEVTVGGK